MKSFFHCILIFFFQFNLLLANAVVLNPIDLSALQSIRMRLQDLPGSNYFSSWNFSSSDPCTTFAGVQCDDAGRVTVLNLGEPRAASPGLTGRLDPAIGNLSYLTELTLVPGRVYGPLPWSLHRLKRLRFLGISRNFITGEIPADLDGLRQLQTLDLSFNQLTGYIPPAIGTLPALSTVVLRRNKIAGSVPKFVSGKLIQLDLKQNNLSGTIPPHGLPSSLEYLSLAANSLSGPMDRVLSRLDRLTYIDISMNQFSGPIPADLFTFPIGALYLQRNQFSGTIHPVSPVTIPTVDLSFNRLSGEISPMLATVQSLYLNDNRFSGQVPGDFVDRLLAGEIELLYLQHNYLTGIAINPLAKIPAKSSLCVQYNCMVVPVETPCPARAGTQKARPIEQCMSLKG